MMNKKSIIDSKDVDIYYLRFPKHKKTNPFSKIRLEHYVLAELEKIHPFFGIHCRVDIRLIIKNLHLFLCITVMDVITLEKYQCEKNHTDLYVAVQDKKYRPLLKVYSPSQRIWKKYIGVASLLIICVCVTLMLHVPKKPEVLPPSQANTISLYETPSFVPIFFSQFENWLKNDSLCTSFSYSHIPKKNNEYQTLITASLKGLEPEFVYPSEIDEKSFMKFKNMMTITPVIFHKGIPHLSVSFSETHSEMRTITQSTSTQEAGSLIRKMIIQFGGFLQQENWDKQEYTFTIPLEKWKNFYTYLYEYFVENKKTVKDFSVFCEGLPFVEAKFSITEGIINEKLVLIGEIFSKQEVLHAENLVLEKAKEELTYGLQVNGEFPKKIGNIKKQDGSWLSFYVNHEGKIVAEEEQ